jgi:hypothetical protein
VAQTSGPAAARPARHDRPDDLDRTAEQLVDDPVE